MEFMRSNKVMVYSCDNEPCEQVIELAERADILNHVESGAIVGHSSAAQAGEIAHCAGVGELYLRHYPTGLFQNSDLIDEAR